MRWLITNRNQDAADGFGTELTDLTYWTRADGSGDISSRATWQLKSLDDFKAALISVANTFPDPLATDTPEQKHVTLFVHGYNDDWQETSARYNAIASTLFDGPESMGELVSFDWPSKGSLLGYLPDRVEARKTGDDLTNVLSELYDWVAQRSEEHTS